MMKILGVMIIVILLVAAGMMIYLLVISQGKITPYYDENGQVLEGSVAERSYITINGVKNGMFLRGRDQDNPVLLFVSSGPGTPDYFLNEAYPDMNLEDYYTVCNWEYRGSGMVYDPDMNPASVTTEQMIADTVEMTNYLKERFHKDKIYIMGFSGGSYIALKTVQAHPENYYAYIGMAQLITSDAENDTYIYDFMKKVFTERKDKASLRKLEKVVTHLDKGQVETTNWASFIYLLHDAGGGTIRDKSEFEGIVLPIMKCRCYTLKEKFNYIKGMRFYRTTALQNEQGQNDFRESASKLEVPVYFFSGAYDYNAPWPLVEQYSEQLDAPIKHFYSFDQAAHSPLWEQPEDAVRILATDILEETLPANDESRHVKK